jgi:serine/threonine protein phosphatase PrpC
MTAYEILDTDEFPIIAATIDGMGGYEGGAFAANIVAGIFADSATKKNFGQKFDPVADEEILRVILEKATRQMVSEALGSPKLSEMGAALSGVVIRANGATAFNCGDCRVYRVSCGEIERLTRDHSVVQALFERGVIDEDGMRSHPKKNVVTSAVTANLAEKPELYVRGVSRVEGDDYFLCSDGVWEALSAELLKDILKGPFPDTANSIFETLIESNCKDNVSFIWASDI